MNVELSSIFFKLLIEAIVQEENELNKLFDNNNEKYQNFLPYGVSCLFETTYVYIIIKQLLRNKFPLFISWEHPYSNDTSKKADLALLDDVAPNEIINSFIEFKIWKSEDGKEIKEDIEKLKQINGIDKYIVAIEYNSENFIGNVEFLEKTCGLKIIHKVQLLTSYFENGSNKQVPMNIYFAKVK